jgi:protein-arginine kinase activator protein McsA
LTEVVVGLHGSDRQPVDEDLQSQVRERRRRQLEDDLRQALAQEDYVQAGRLRDLIRVESDPSTSV